MHVYSEQGSVEWYSIAFLQSDCLVKYLVPSQINSFFFLEFIFCLILTFYCCCRAEAEGETYRKIVAEKGLSVDDTDEEWEEQFKDQREGKIRFVIK